MPNIVDYVKSYGDFSFKDKEFSVEDALVLCQFSYLKFDGLIDEMSDKPMPIKQLYSLPGVDLLFSDNRYEKDRRKLLKNIVESKRFGDASIYFYINRIEVQNETQFAALTYFLPGFGYFVAFRGTDENIVGWQEDFKMALDRPIRGQLLSVEYIDEVARRLPSSFMVGGHSKGGNLAMYSAMNCKMAVQKRIEKIFSFDGPGFRPEVLAECNFEAIKDRVVSVIPRSSLVGLLLTTDSESIVVSSNTVSALQHNPYSWVLRNGSFVKRQVSQAHLTWIKTFNEWLFSLGEEELERFICLFEEVLKATEADTTLELSKETIKCASNVIAKAKNVDDSTKEFLSSIMKSYFSMAKDIVKNDVKEKLESDKHKRADKKAKENVRKKV